MTAGNILLENLGAWLARPTTRASYNYGISTDGRVGLFVKERNRSWASSSRDNDNAAVTIGVANNRVAPYWTISAAAWEKLVELCVDICYRNPGIVQEDGIARGLWYNGTPNGSLTTHDMFSRQVCPGPYLKARLPELCREVNKRLAEKLGGLTMSQYEELKAMIENLSDAVDTISDVVMPRFRKISELPAWAREEHIDAYNRGIIQGVKLSEGADFDVEFSTSLSWKEMRANVKAYRRERGK